MTSATPMQPARFSTAGLPYAQRVAMWEEHNADALIGLRCRSIGEGSLEATEINLQLARLHLARVIGTSHVVERTTEIIRRAPTDAVACYFTLDGEAFFYHDDGVRIARPGQLIVCDADRPFMRGFSRGLKELVIKVPRAEFQDVTGLDSLREPLTLDFARGDVRARTLAQLVGRAVRPEKPEGAEEVDEQTVLDLLGGLVVGRPEDLATVHLATAKQYVEDHLTDPGLSASRIAAGIGVSARHLSRVFASSGSSVPQYVLTRRLRRARALLGEGGELTVAQVATACGFGSAAHFSHVFKEHYGIRATDVLRDSRSARAR